MNGNKILYFFEKNINLGFRSFKLFKRFRILYNHSKIPQFVYLDNIQTNALHF